MDMQMPVMDGLAAVRTIRADEAERSLPRTPIIMLTANALPEHVAAAQAAGADLHLAKPITAATLFEAIASALGGEEEPAAGEEAAA
jgi:CheY-like chemotaxis protein